MITEWQKITAFMLVVAIIVALGIAYIVHDIFGKMHTKEQPDFVCAKTEQRTRLVLIPVGRIMTQHYVTESHCISYITRESL